MKSNTFLYLICILFAMTTTGQADLSAELRSVKEEWGRFKRKLFKLREMAFQTCDYSTIKKREEEKGFFTAIFAIKPSDPEVCKTVEKFLMKRFKKFAREWKTKEEAETTQDQGEKIRWRKGNLASRVAELIGESGGNISTTAGKKVDAALKKLTEQISNLLGKDNDEMD